MSLLIVLMLDGLSEDLYEWDVNLLGPLGGKNNASLRNSLNSME